MRNKYNFRNIFKPILSGVFVVLLTVTSFPSITYGQGEFSFVPLVPHEYFLGALIKELGTPCNEYPAAAFEENLTGIEKGNTLCIRISYRNMSGPAVTPQLDFTGLDYLDVNSVHSQRGTASYTQNSSAVTVTMPLIDYNELDRLDMEVSVWPIYIGDDDLNPGDDHDWNAYRVELSDSEEEFESITTADSSYTINVNSAEYNLPTVAGIDPEFVEVGYGGGILAIVGQFFLYSEHPVHEPEVELCLGDECTVLSMDEIIDTGNLKVNLPLLAVGDYEVILTNPDDKEAINHPIFEVKPILAITSDPEVTGMAGNDTLDLEWETSRDSKWRFGYGVGCGPMAQYTFHPFWSGLGSSPFSESITSVNGLPTVAGNYHYAILVTVDGVTTVRADGCDQVFTINDQPSDLMATQLPSGDIDLGTEVTLTAGYDDDYLPYPEDERDMEYVWTRIGEPYSLEGLTGLDSETLSFTPTDSDSDGHSYSFNLHICDSAVRPINGNRLCAEKAISVPIEYLNHAPTAEFSWSEDGDDPVLPGDRITLDGRGSHDNDVAYFPDGYPDPPAGLTYSWDINGDMFSGEIFSFDAGDYGTEYHVRLTVSDGEMSDTSDEQVIEVGADNYPPAVDLIPPTQYYFRSDQPIIFNFTASEPCRLINPFDILVNGEVLDTTKYDFDGTCGGGPVTVTIPSEGLDLADIFPSDNSYVITVRAYDGAGNSGTDDFELIYDHTAPQVLTENEVFTQIIAQSGDPLELRYQVDRYVGRADLNYTRRGQEINGGNVVRLSIRDCGEPPFDEGNCGIDQEYGDETGSDGSFLMYLPPFTDNHYYGFKIDVIDTAGNVNEITDSVYKYVHLNYGTQARMTRYTVYPSPYLSFGDGEVTVNFQVSAYRSIGAVRVYSMASETPVELPFISRDQEILDAYFTDWVPQQTVPANHGEVVITRDDLLRGLSEPIDEGSTYYVYLGFKVCPVTQVAECLADIDSVGVMDVLARDLQDDPFGLIVSGELPGVPEITEIDSRDTAGLGVDGHSTWPHDNLDCLHGGIVEVSVPSTRTLPVIEGTAMPITDLDTVNLEVYGLDNAVLRGAEYYYMESPVMALVTGIDISDSDEFSYKYTLGTQVHPLALSTGHLPEDLPIWPDCRVVDPGDGEFHVYIARVQTVGYTGEDSGWSQELHFILVASDAMGMGGTHRTVDLPSAVTADGSDSYTAKLYLMDRYGNLVSDAEVQPYLSADLSPARVDAFDPDSLSAVQLDPGDGEYMVPAAEIGDGGVIIPYYTAYVRSYAPTVDTRDTIDNVVNDDYGAALVKDIGLQFLISMIDTVSTSRDVVYGDYIDSDGDGYADGTEEYFGDQIDLAEFMPQEYEMASPDFGGPFSVDIVGRISTFLSHAASDTIEYMVISPLWGVNEWDEVGENFGDTPEYNAGGEVPAVKFAPAIEVEVYHLVSENDGWVEAEKIDGIDLFARVTGRLRVKVSNVGDREVNFDAIGREIAARMGFRGDVAQFDEVQIENLRLITGDGDEFELTTTDYMVSETGADLVISELQAVRDQYGNERHVLDAGSELDLDLVVNTAFSKPNVLSALGDFDCELTYAYAGVPLTELGEEASDDIEVNYPCSREGINIFSPGSYTGESPVIEDSDREVYLSRVRTEILKNVEKLTRPKPVNWSQDHGDKAASSAMRNDAIYLGYQHGGRFRMTDYRDADEPLIGFTEAEKGVEPNFAEDEFELGGANNGSDVYMGGKVVLIQNRNVVIGWDDLDSDGVIRELADPECTENCEWIADKGDTLWLPNEDMTLVVIGGNVIIRGNLAPDTDSSFGVVVLAEEYEENDPLNPEPADVYSETTMNESKKGGNVLVTPNVTDLPINIYVEGAMLGVNEQEIAESDRYLYGLDELLLGEYRETVDGVTLLHVGTGENINQLYLHGLFSSGVNTSGGFRRAEPYGVEVAEYDRLNQVLDLSLFREYVPLFTMELDDETVPALKSGQLPVNSRYTSRAMVIENEGLNRIPPVFATLPQIQQNMVR